MPVSVLVCHAGHFDLLYELGNNLPQVIVRVSDARVFVVPADVAAQVRADAPKMRFAAVHDVPVVEPVHLGVGRLRTVMVFD